MNSKKFQEIKEWRDRFKKLMDKGVSLYPRQKQEFERVDFLITLIEGEKK